MKNQCLEIGIVLLPFWPPIKSYSTVKTWLKCCIIWEVFLGAGPFLPDRFLWALTTAWISLSDSFCLVLQLCACLMLASHLSKGLWARGLSLLLLCPPQQTFVHSRCSCKVSANSLLVNEQRVYVSMLTFPKSKGDNNPLHFLYSPL